MFPVLHRKLIFKVHLTHPAASDYRTNSVNVARRIWRAGTVLIRAAKFKLGHYAAGAVSHGAQTHLADSELQTGIFLSNDGVLPSSPELDDGLISINSIHLSRHQEPASIPNAAGLVNCYFP